MAVYRQDVIKNSLGQPESDLEAAAKRRMQDRTAKRRDGHSLGANGAVVVTTGERAPAGQGGSFSTEEARLTGGAYDLPAEVAARILMQARSSSRWIASDQQRAAALDKFIKAAVAKELAKK